MDEDYGYEYNEGSDIDNWEDEQVFQDHEGQEDEETSMIQAQRVAFGYFGPHTPAALLGTLLLYEAPREDFGYFGEMGMMED